MRLRHARYARVAGVLKALLVSRNVHRAGDRGAFSSCNRAGSVRPVKAAGRRIRTLSAEFVMGAAGRTPGKHKGGREK